jgi:hypothetical protein
MYCDEMCAEVDVFRLSVSVDMFHYYCLLFEAQTAQSSSSFPFHAVGPSLPPTSHG